MIGSEPCPGRVELGTKYHTGAQIQSLQSGGKLEKGRKPKRVCGARPRRPYKRPPVHECSTTKLRTGIADLARAQGLDVRRRGAGHVAGGACRRTGGEGSAASAGAVWHCPAG